MKDALVMKETVKHSLAELATKSGVPARTIRFYIARGLLAGPDKPGRDAGYGQEHLQRVKQIQAMQSAGATLSEIAFKLAGGHVEKAVQPSVAWRHLQVSDDVVIMVRGDAAPWRVHQVGKTAMELQQYLAGNKGGDQS